MVAAVGEGDARLAMHRARGRDRTYVLFLVGDSRPGRQIGQIEHGLAQQKAAVGAECRFVGLVATEEARVGALVEDRIRYRVDQHLHEQQLVRQPCLVLRQRRRAFGHLGFEFAAGAMQLVGRAAQVLPHPLLGLDQTLDLEPVGLHRRVRCQVEVADALAALGEFAQRPSDPPCEARRRTGAGDPDQQHDQPDRRHVAQPGRHEIILPCKGTDPGGLLAETERFVAPDPALVAEFEAEGLAGRPGRLHPGLMARAQIGQVALGDRCQQHLAAHRVVLQAVVARQAEQALVARQHRRATDFADTLFERDRGQVGQQNVEGEDAGAAVGRLPARRHRDAGLARGVEGVVGRPEVIALGSEGHRPLEPGPGARIVAALLPFRADLHQLGVPAQPRAALADVVGRGAATSPAIAVADQEQFAAVLLRQQHAGYSRMGTEQRRHQCDEAVAVVRIQPTAAAPGAGGAEKRLGRAKVARDQLGDVRDRLLQRVVGQCPGGGPDHREIPADGQGGKAQRQQQPGPQEQAAGKSGT